MTRIHNEIEILATPAAIWETLTDFESYVIWNPFIRRAAASKLVAGEKLDIFLQPSGQRGMRIRPYVRRLDAPRELRWQSQVLHPLLLYGEHTFLLRPAQAGTLFIQILKFGGLLTPLALSVIYSDTLRGMAEMNAALKIRVERSRLSARTAPAFDLPV